jgi:3-methyl-2-oxobutanoate hydroxymethyltransferase
VKRYVELGQIVRKVVEAYCHEVREGTFPAAEHEFK